ncbi:WD40 repeat domain-containing protein [Thermococcus sp. Bubb.Bath]|uniref:WD40 repeat domain-containing protein n=1 Tax=Thermococcus sp. Bubb.Bath TaxID=1638242 RepID=UPI00143B0C0E|nr:WD40 repeat domain-containing protein [Thermococcus sp. Bubb.Bath]NJF24134.1 WD40 repeat domain-containing protein [Thermococcus sp. Bubb.Bath]
MEEVKRILPILVLLMVILLTPYTAAEPSWSWTYSDACMVFSLAINDEGYTAAGFGYDVLLLSPNGSRVYKVPSRGFSYSIAISEDNYVVAGTKGFFVQLFSPEGKPIFEYKTGDQVWAVDISPDGKTFVAGSNDSWIYLFKRGTGLIWKRNTRAPIWGTILNNGTIYSGNDAGIVGAYDINGKSLWNQRLGGRVWRNFALREPPRGPLLRPGCKGPQTALLR